jgi:hypothetical protein
MTTVAPLPPTFATSREGLHRLACFVIAPGRLARAGEIGLRATPGGFGTPPFDDGTTIAVRGAELVVGDRTSPITTLRDGAALVGIELSATPDVGRDLPPFEPAADLAVDAAAALALGDWYAVADGALARLDPAVGAISAATLWPEHFDLAVVIGRPDGSKVNVGFSPGDAASDEPYAYVGPWDTSGLADDYWNISFGALRTRRELGASGDLGAAADAFIAEGLARLAATGSSPPDDRP